MAGIKTADEYVASQKAEHREMLEDLRGIIKSVIPEAEEIISFSIICYQYYYMLVGIGTKKGHCSFYTMNPGYLESIADKLGDLEYSGSTLYFKIDRPLPEELIRSIVQERVEQNEFRSIAMEKMK